MLITPDMLRLVQEARIILAEERRRYILDKLNSHGRLHSGELARELGVSEVTLRSDLKELEREGHLKRVYGGAVRSRIQRYDPEFQEQIAIDVEEKREIAAKAARIVEKNDIIFVDSGSTTLFFFEELSKSPPLNLTVITNSLYIINAVAQTSRINLVVMGGTFQQNTMNFLDFEINSFLSRYNVNKAFLGINGIDENGYYASNILEAEAKKLICDVCDDIYVLASSSKLFKRSLVLIREWTGNEHLVLPDLGEDIMHRFEKLKQEKHVTIA